jgi:hypothetical protein
MRSTSNIPIPRASMQPGFCIVTCLCCLAYFKQLLISMLSTQRGSLLPRNAKTRRHLLMVEESDTLQERMKFLRRWSCSFFEGYEYEKKISDQEIVITIEIVKLSIDKVY